MIYEYLNRINSPDDLKKMPDESIPVLCEEIRSFLVESVETNGGHLASNLGVVELSVAIHRVFDSPRDHIIFDVGHQSYVHKIITGRRDAFTDLRKVGGLSGFTKMSESQHDAFGAGHSSTSVSAALGYAEADRINGSTAHTVAVLGDGAYTGGMVHEAINNCDPELNMIIVLNENGMSISLNKGSFATYLSKVRISKSYRGWKKGTNSFLYKVPGGKYAKNLLTYFRNKFKNLFYSSNYFEDLGLYYMGPIDGNDYKKVENALKKAKALNKCVVVHLKTVKGKGYNPAENEPESFHGLVASTTNTSSTFHSEAVGWLIKQAESEEKIVAVTAAMGVGTGLNEFGQRFADRYFDVGIAEGHALTFCAGMAAAGFKPYTAIYSTFLQRGYDSIVHDIALQKLPVRMLVDRAGLSLADGATHHGIFDVSFLSHIPDIEIFAPATYDALTRALNYSKDITSPIAIRYPNSSESSMVADKFYKNGFTIGEWVRCNFDPKNPPKRIFITYGIIAERVLEAAEFACSESEDSIGVILLERLKPYNEIAKTILPCVKEAKKIVFVEEGIEYGGAGMLLKNELDKISDIQNYKIAAIEDNFASPNYKCNLWEYVGLFKEILAKKILENEY